MLKISRFSTAILGAGLAQLMLLAVLFVGAVPQGMAATDDRCTGGHWICATYINSKWESITGNQAKAYIDISNFQWEDSPSSYPVTSTNIIQRQTHSIFVAYLGNKYSQSNPAVTIVEDRGQYTKVTGTATATPTSSLVWDSTNEAFKIIGGTDQNLQYLRFKFWISAGNEADVFVGSGTTTFNVDLPLPSNRKPYREYAAKIKVQAMVLEGMPSNVTEVSLPETKILSINFMGLANMGEVWISGSSKISPLPVIKPKTCTVWTNKEYRTVDLGRHTTGEFEAVAIGGELGNGTHTDALVLKACPANLTVGLRLDEAPGLPAGVTTDPSKVYLVNRHNNAAERAGGGGVRVYYDNARSQAKLSSGQQEVFTISSSDKEIKTRDCGSGSTSCDNDIFLKARLYKTGTVTAGKITSQAILTITYH